MHRVRNLPTLLVLAALAAGTTACALISQAMAPPPTTSLDVVSYNIRHGQGMDDRVDLQRTAAVLLAQTPDIVALQEVDDRVQRSGRVDQARELGRLLGLKHAFGAFMDFQGGRYGMATLSRFPILSSWSIALPDGSEPRIALATEIELPNRARIVAVNVHFDWLDDDNDRYRQAVALARVLDTLSLPYIVLGDFNDQRNSRTLRIFQDMAVELRKPSDDRFTFSSTNPTKEIDHVFVGPERPWRIGRIAVIDEKVASDHRPLIATIEHTKGR
ncbi:MAG: endonuclease/exonuclease/phosphatase family protein [Gemmatimonadales bacterium]